MLRSDGFRNEARLHETQDVFCSDLQAATMARRYSVLSSVSFKTALRVSPTERYPEQSRDSTPETGDCLCYRWGAFSFGSLSGSLLIDEKHEMTVAGPVKGGKC